MIKALIKNGLAGVLYYSGGMALTRLLIKGHSGAVILMYHRVLPERSISSNQLGWEKYRSLPGIVVTPEMFEQQIEFLSSKYSIISLSTLLASIAKGGELPPRTIVITFDDGWRDNYDYAFPLLKKYNLPATIFLTTGYVDTTAIFWPEQVIGSLLKICDNSASDSEKQSSAIPTAIAQQVGAIASKPPSLRIELIDQLINAMKRWPLEERQTAVAALRAVGLEREEKETDTRVMLNWKEIREMQSGGISFGSHCVTHELLTDIELAQAEREMRESKQVIDTQLGGTVEAIAYPNGNFNAKIKEIAKRVGYRCALSVQRGRVDATSDLYELRRVNVHQGCSSGLFGGFSPGLFTCHIEGIPR